MPWHGMAITISYAPETPVVLAVAAIARNTCRNRRRCDRGAATGVTRLAKDANTSPPPASRSRAPERDRTNRQEKTWTSRSANSSRRSKPALSNFAPASAIPTGWRATATAGFPMISTGDGRGRLARHRDARGAMAARGLGITEAAVMMQAVAATRRRMTGASAIHMNIFGPTPGGRVRHRRAEGALAAAAHRGRDEALLRRHRARRGPEHRRDSRRARSGAATAATWCTARRSGSRPRRSPNKILLLARTTPLDECARPTDGLTPVLHRPRPRPRRGARDREDGAQGGRLERSLHRRPRDPVGGPHRRGGRGLFYLLHGINPERILIAAEAHRHRARRAGAARPRYARERIVFGRPIGQNQAIQHPLAELWIELEAARLMALAAAWLYDAGKTCGAGGQRGQVPGRRDRLRGLHAGGADPWRHGLRQGVSRRALLAGGDDPATRPGQPATHSVLHRREGAGATQVVLTWPTP